MHSCFIVLPVNQGSFFDSTSLRGVERLYRSSATSCSLPHTYQPHTSTICCTCLQQSAMGPPRRARSNSSVSNYSQQYRDRHPQSLEPPPPDSIPPTQSHLGMSPQSRYLSNMKVVRRRDPSIVSIFDQFSHVCVYHHNGDKWEKQGYEGSMFLYERSVLRICAICLHAHLLPAQ